MNVNRKKALVLGGVIVLLAGGSLFGFKKYDKHQHQVAKKELTAKLNDFKKIKTEVDSYVLPEGYLSKNVSTDSLEKSATQLTALKDFSTSKYMDKKEVELLKKNVGDIIKEVDTIALKFTTQQELNSLFDADVIVANDVKEDGVVKEDVQSVDIDTSDFQKEGWLTSVQKEIKVVEDQVKVKLEATHSVEQLFSQDKVKEGVTRKNYDDSANKLKLVKNKKVQTRLNEKLKKVDNELKRLDTLAKEKVEKEAKEIGGTVEKKTDGSYVVIPPKKEANVQSEVASTTNGTENNQSYSASNGSSYNGAATSNYSQTPSSNFNGSSNSSGGSQSSGGNVSSGESSGNSNIVTNGGNNSANNDYWSYIGKNPNTGGDVYIGQDVINIEDIPGIEFVTGK